MEYLVIVLLILAVLGAASRISSKRAHKKLTESIKRFWGSLPDSEDVETWQRDLIAVRFKRSRKAGERFLIDDRTWESLNGDALFNRLNGTWSDIGEAYLYFALRKPLLDRASYEAREKLIRYWKNHTKARETVAYRLALMGKSRSKGLVSVYHEEPFQELNNKLPFKVMTFLPFAAIPCFFLNSGFGLFVLVIALAANSVYHQKLVKELDEKIPALTRILSFIHHSAQLAKLHLPELKDRTVHIQACCQTLEPAARGAVLLQTRGENAFNEALGLFELIKMMFFIDVWKYDRCAAFLGQHKDCLADLADEIGEWDATLAMASYHEAVKATSCVPIIRWDNDGQSLVDEERDAMTICAEGGIHPLIAGCVPNPVKISKPLLLTGSNASGKSTYLKMTALNALTAHTLLLCHGTSWRSAPLFPVVSMNLKDDLLTGESYFMAEIKTLKSVFSLLNPQVKCLCVVDEVLRGTNTIERIAASSRLLKRLAGKNACILAATHDTELTGILENYYENMHFTEEVTADTISFDYKIKPGRATTRNAIRLLDLLGFEKEVVEDAYQAVERFEKDRAWKSIP